MRRAEPPLWSVPVAVHDVPESGRRFELAADEHVRNAVANAMGVPAVPHLQASFEVTRHGRDGLRVTGQVAARLEQTCVLTLEPIESEILEPVDLVFIPQAAAEAADQPTERRSAPANEAPEPLVGGVVDLGLLATEFLVLGVDPYPRKLGATFEAPIMADGGEHPFAALAALKKESGRS